MAEKSQFVGTKRDLAFMYTVYANHFGSNVPLTEHSDKHEAKLALAEYRRFTGQIVTRPVNHKLKREQGDNYKHPKPGVVGKWLALQIEEAWGL